MFSFGGRDPHWFPQRMLAVIEAAGGLIHIEALLKLNVPIRLLIEVLRPYVYCIRTKAVESKSISAKKLLSVSSSPKSLPRISPSESAPSPPPN